MTQFMHWEIIVGLDLVYLLRGLRAYREVLLDTIQFFLNSFRSAVPAMSEERFCNLLSIGWRRSSRSEAVLVSFS